MTYNFIKMSNILIQIFIVSFFLNLLWEVIHSQLYTTCLDAPLKKYIPLIIFASIKDAFFITLFYLISVFIFDNKEILDNPYQLLFFIITSLTFSFIDEKVSLKQKRWQYSKEMPSMFGVWITPLLEIAVTWLVCFWWVF